MNNRRRRRSEAGFSLMELLIVIAIILIILAVAVPKLTKARTFAQEMAAQKALNTIHTAETEYYWQYGQYATSLTQLGPPASGSPSANGAELIDKELASGEKGNYKYSLQASPTGYTVTAVPTQFGVSGNHTYYSDQSMAIHQHSGPEPATSNDPLAGEKDQTQNK
jgi:prepilin-type N-terminal cleavage/methylation domain-containing protein